MLGLLNWPVILAAALLAAVALYVRRPGFLRVSLMIVLIGHADVAAKSIIIFTRNAAALFHLTLPNNWHSGLRLRSIVDLALVAVLLFLGFGFQPASQFLLPRWRHARRFLLVKTGSQPATALCLAALAVGFCLAISAAFLLLIAIAFLVLPYAASPAFCTFLVFGSLLIWRRFPSKAVFGASIAFAISLIATWFFGRYPALESCGYILTVGVDCIVYGVFFFPADSEVDWSKRPG